MGIVLIFTLSHDPGDPKGPFKSFKAALRDVG